MFSTCQKDIFYKHIPKNYLKTLLFISAIKRALKQVNFSNFVNQKRAVTSFYYYQIIFFFLCLPTFIRFIVVN